MIQAAIKIILSLIFMLCLLQMPYGYYQAVRLLGMVGFALLAYFAKKQNKTSGVIIYIALALLFQPFIKIALGRPIWNVVDVVVSIGLILSLFTNKKKVL